MRPTLGACASALASPGPPRSGELAPFVPVSDEAHAADLDERAISELVAVDDAWADAIVANDAQRIAAFTADEWVIVSESGVSSTDRFLSLVASGELTHSAMDRVGEPRVRIHGAMATVTARVTNTAHFGGERFEADEWTTDVFERREGRWVCVLSHITPAAVPAAEEERVTLQVAHTSELGDTVLGQARALLVDVFEGDLGDEDWEHALGGVHALAWDGDDLVGHAAVVQRRLLHLGRALRAGYVEGVGVRADRRRHGHAAVMMTALERVIGAGYDLGALGSTEQALAFYRGRGWQRWRGRCSSLTPDGVRPTPDEQGGILVLEGVVALDLDAELTCDWRDGDVW